jgi:hypothetical protein
MGREGGIVESIWIAIPAYTGGWNGFAGVYGMYPATERQRYAC